MWISANLWRDFKIKLNRKLYLLSWFKSKLAIKLANHEKLKILALIVAI